MAQNSTTPAATLNTLTLVVSKPRRQFGRVRRKAAFCWLLKACLFAMGCLFGLPIYAQSAASESAPVAASTAAPSVVRWNGSLPQAAGRSVEIHFALFQDQAGGLALWSETQTVAVGADGRYTVLLGAASAEGLPQTLFQSGEARWLEALPVSAAAANATSESVAAGAPARSLLAAAPYAFESVDAETLAGRAAADYVTREDLQSAVAGSVQAAAQSNPQVTPALAGTGDTDYVPLWTGSNTLGNSAIVEKGSDIGIGTASPATTLDVNGASTLRSTVILPSKSATASNSYYSPALELQASAYSSTSAAAVAQTFALAAFPEGNDTASPSSVLELLFGSGTTSPKSTGLSFAPNGQITFASGQKFPGTGAGTITGVTATSPLTGAGTTGAVTLGLNIPALETTLNGVYPQLGAANKFTKPITFAAGQTFPGTGAGTITGVTAGAALTGGGTTGAVFLNVDTTKVPLLASANTFTGANTFSKPIAFAAGQTFPGAGGAGTITGVTAGSGLKGGGATGAVSLAIDPTVVPALSGNNTFKGSTGFVGPVNFEYAGQSFPNTVSGLTVSSPLTQSASSGAVSLGLNTSALETTLNGVYPQLDANNGFTGTNKFSKPVIFAAGQTFPGAGSGTITGVTAGQGLTGGGASGAVTLAVDTTQIPLLNFNNTYQGEATFMAPVSAQDSILTNYLEAASTLQATSTAPGPSGVVEIGTSSYNSNSAAPVEQNFAWTAIPDASDTANPTAELDLQFSSGFAQPASTGLSIAPTGVITFASGQTFPGAGSGGVTTGSNTFTGTQTVTSSSTAVDAASTQSEGTAIWGVDEASGGTGVDGQGNEYGVFGLGEGNNANSIGVYGISVATNGTGVYGNASTGTGVNGIATSGTGVSGSSSGGNGVLGSTSATGGPAGVYGNSTTASIGGDGYPGIGVSGNAQGPSSWGVYGYSSDTNGIGVNGTAPNIGIQGTSTNGQIGVYGTANGNGQGVYGWAVATGVTGHATGSNGIGVNGSAPNIGVQGSSTNGQIGVYGTATGNGQGVYGYTTGTASTGVYGQSTGLIGTGVTGSGSVGVAGSGGTGVFGASTSGPGVWGTTSAGGQYGVSAQNTATSGTGGALYALSSAVSAWAIHAVSYQASLAGATFFGNTGAAIWADAGNPPSGSYENLGALVASADDGIAGNMANSSSEPTLLLFNDGSGSTLQDFVPARAEGNSTQRPAVPVLSAAGAYGACGMNTAGDVYCSGNHKSAVTLAGSKQQVEVYSVQSAENWIEDFGSGTLTNGRVTVALDPMFAKTVNAGVAYHVFLTPKGDSKGLYVINETPSSFEVRESGGGTSGVEFDYRIVAKRIGFERQRLADATAEMHQLVAKSERIRRTSTSQPDAPRPDTRTILPPVPVIARQPQIPDHPPQPAPVLPALPVPVHPPAAQQPAPAKPLPTPGKDKPARLEKPESHS